MGKYWTCTKFADIIRGTPKLKYGTGDEWAQWKKLASKKHPARYWIAETALNKLEKAFTWPIRQINNVKYYIKNRYVYKTHALTASTLRPGFWYEFDTRMLYCAFDTLVDFVERDLDTFLAYHEELNEERIKNAASSGFNPEDAAEKEIFELYNWWKHERPARPSPYDVSGYRKIYARRRAANIGLGQTTHESVATREEIQTALKINSEIYRKYRDEDQQMLIRLVNIRSSIWR